MRMELADSVSGTAGSEYKCTSLLLAHYYTAAMQIINELDEVSFCHLPREANWEADELAQVASGVQMSEELRHKLILV